MKIHQRISATIVILAVANIGLRPEYISSALVVLASIALYGFTVFVENREDSRFEEFESKFAKRLKDLDEKVQSIAIARGMGR